MFRLSSLLFWQGLTCRPSDVTSQQFPDPHLSLTFVMNVDFADFTFDSLSGVTSQHLLTHVARCGQPVCCLQEHVTSHLPTNTTTNTTTTTTTIPNLHLRAEASDGGHPGRGVASSGLVSPRHCSATTVLLTVGVVAFRRLKSGMDNLQSENISKTDCLLSTCPQAPMLLVDVLTLLLVPLVFQPSEFIK